MYDVCNMDVGSLMFAEPPPMPPLSCEYLAEHIKDKSNRIYSSAWIVHWPLRLLLFYLPGVLIFKTIFLDY